MTTLPGPRLRRTQYSPASASDHALTTALRSSIVLLQIALALSVVIYLTSNVTIVGPEETALLYRLGRLEGMPQKPGLLLAFPKPIDEVVKIPSGRVQELELDGWAPRRVPNGDPMATGQSPTVLRALLHPAQDGYTVTGDLNIVQGRFAVRYQIVDPTAFVMATRNARDFIAAAVYDGLTTAVAGTPVDEVLSRGLADLRAKAMQVAQDKLDALGSGVRLLGLEVPSINPGAQVMDAFEEVVSARVEARTLVEKANGYEASEVPAARAQANRLREEARSYAADLKARSQGESGAFIALLAEYRRAPDLIRTRLRNETLRQVLSQVRTTTVMPAAGHPWRLVLPIASLPSPSPARKPPVVVPGMPEAPPAATPSTSQTWPSL